MLDTGLRPKTLDQLRVPEHSTKSAEVLRITAGIDKNEYARTLRLTDAARAALDSVCPGEGLIFGRHDYRPPLKKAAKQVLPPHLAATFTVYDLVRRRGLVSASPMSPTGSKRQPGPERIRAFGESDPQSERHC